MLDSEFEERKERAYLDRSVRGVVEDVHPAAQFDDRYRDHADSYAYAVLRQMESRPESAPGEHQREPDVQPFPVKLHADPGVEVELQQEGRAGVRRQIVSDRLLGPDVSFNWVDEPPIPILLPPAGTWWRPLKRE